MPVMRRASPSARTMGQGVGAGRTTTSLRCSCAESGFVWCVRSPSCIALPPLWSLSAENVNDREYDDPDGVDEVPVEREHLEFFCVLFFHEATEREYEGERKHDEADDDVARMQADQRVVGCAEEIRLEGQALVVDEVIPLLRGCEEEDRPEYDGTGEIEDEAS